MFEITELVSEINGMKEDFPKKGAGSQAVAKSCEASVLFTSATGVN